MTPTDLETLRGLIGPFGTEADLALTALLADYERLRQDSETLLKACEQEFTSEATEEGDFPCADNEAVMDCIYTTTPITFGMIRKLRATLKGEKHE